MALSARHPNLAARLQGIAEPNTAVIAEATQKLLGNLFELQDLGAKHLKGIARLCARLGSAPAELGRKPFRRPTRQ